MKPHVACRSRELEKHLLELWRAEAGATLLSVAGIAVNVLIVEWSEVKVAYVANEVGGAALRAGHGWKPSPHSWYPSAEVVTG
jgi:hypothetical protein